jgi:tRNA nucleotidyltransferase/poly(A) polymerase
MIPITFSIQSKLVELIKSLEASIAPATIRLVGGCIRDLMIGQTPKDWDMITDATPEQIILQLGLDNVGKGFPVFLLHDDEFGQIEIACCRTERKIGTGHNGFETKVCQSFEEDAQRRDLTVNACSWHHSTPDQVYCYNQSTEDDFKNKRLHHMSPAFAEDPLRVFRVARFATQLSAHNDRWGVDLNTYSMMKSLKDELKTLPPDRVRGEMEAAFYKSTPAHREIFFNTLKAVGAMEYWFPELSDNRYHIVVDKDSEFKKEMVYLSIAYAISANNYSSSQNIKEFCNRLQIGLSSEMNTFSILYLIVTRYIKTKYIDELEMLILCKSMLRGKVTFDCYIKVFSEIRPSQDTQKILKMISLVCMELKNQKFTSADNPGFIKQEQLNVAREFIELFLM